jgi:hypothetical protein
MAGLSGSSQKNMQQAADTCFDFFYLLLCVTYRNGNVSKEEIDMADIIASVSSAINLAETLEEKSSNLENNELKNILAELNLELIEIRDKIAEYLTERNGFNTKNSVLFGESCELCPVCKNFTLEMISCKPHPIFGDIGGTDREVNCSLCGFRETRYVDL